MAKDVLIAGALFEDVPKIQVPDGNGVFHGFVDVSDTTAAAADVASGKYFYDAAGTLTEGTSSGGGGGASNIVKGEFSPSVENGSQDVTIPYTGNGYIVSLKICIKGGINNPQATYGSLVRRYAIGIALLDKNNYSSSPTYNHGGDDSGRIITAYKGSSASAETMTTGSNLSSSVKPYDDASAESGSAGCIKIRSKTKFSFYSTTQASGYSGFLIGQTYEYIAVYSE